MNAIVSLLDRLSRLNYEKNVARAGPLGRLVTTLNNTNGTASHQNRHYSPLRDIYNTDKCFSNPHALGVLH